MVQGMDKRKETETIDLHREQTLHLDSAIITQLSRIQFIEILLTRQIEKQN